jgi:hypothetical protein
MDVDLGQFLTEQPCSIIAGGTPASLVLRAIPGRLTIANVTGDPTAPRVYAQA